MTNKKPEKVFIRENENYIELTYTEYLNLCKQNVVYQQKLFIPIQGYILEVTAEEYKDYYKDLERQAYLTKLDIENALLSIDEFITEEDNGSGFITSEEDVLETVTRKHMYEELYKAIAILKKEEREVIENLYFNVQKVSEFSKKSGIPERTIRYRRNSALKKINNFFEKSCRKT